MPQDTLQAGDGLCDERAVRVLVEEGPRYVRELISWGANFDRDEHGELAFGLEAAHSVRRILHAGDATGRSIGRALWEQVRPLGTVSTINHAFVTDSGRQGRPGGRRLVFRSDRRTATGRGVSGAARDWRCGSGLQRDDESGGCDRRRDRAGVSMPAPAWPISSSSSFIRPR